MAQARRLGFATVAVLQAIANGHGYGFDIMEATERPGGTVYPALAKLESDGLVRSHWEDPLVAQQEKRPPRRYYAITDAGAAKLEEARAWLGPVTAATPGKA